MSDKNMPVGEDTVTSFYPTSSNETLQVPATGSHKPQFTLGELDVFEKIGQGGMAKVYKAYSKKWGKPMAVKVLSEEHAQKEDVKRFKREAKVAVELRHPNIIFSFR